MFNQFPSKFNRATAGDAKHQQTEQRASKGKETILGSTRSASKTTQYVLVETQTIKITVYKKTSTEHL